MKTLVISKQVTDAINEYSHLHLGNKEVCTPYYINEKFHKDLRVIVGKGTTEEIEMEARIWEKLKGLDFNQMSSNDIKQFLIERGIGIDCSGFVIHILNKWYKSITNKPIWTVLKMPRKSLRAWLGYKLRPVENISAQVITNQENAMKINIKDVLPGDLIRSKAKKKEGHHIMIITKVTYDDMNQPILIEYTHSSPYYGMSNGIKTGQIKITDINKELKDQDWLEKDEHGVNHTYEGFLKQVEDNGIRRLYCLAKYQEEANS